MRDKLQQIVSNPGGIVASDSGMFFEVFAQDGDYAQGLDGIEVGEYLVLSSSDTGVRLIRA